MFKINFKTFKEILLDPTTDSFTDLVEKIQDTRDEIGIELFQKTVEIIQVKILERFLGKPYKKKTKKTVKNTLGVFKMWK